MLRLDVKKKSPPGVSPSKNIPKSTRSPWQAAVSADTKPANNSSVTVIVKNAVSAGQPGESTV